MFENDREDDWEGTYSDERVPPPTREELRAAAEIVVFLEHDLGVDVRRLRVRFRGGTVYVQGSVASREQRQEIEQILPTRPGVRAVEASLTVRDEHEEF